MRLGMILNDLTQVKDNHGSRNRPDQETPLILGSHLICSSRPLLLRTTKEIGAAKAASRQIPSARATGGARWNLAQEMQVYRGHA